MIYQNSRIFGSSAQEVVASYWNGTWKDCVYGWVQFSYKYKFRLRVTQRTINSQGGSIWSVAANPASTLLALGCEDGTVRLLSVADDTLTHHRRFDRVKCRILSLSWGPPILRQTKKADSSSSSDEDEDDEWDDYWLVTGCSDSSLRKWDVKSGRMLDRMGTDKIRGERTLVWAVTTLGSALHILCRVFGR
jgi:WD40 repeat protein